MIFCRTAFPIRSFQSCLPAFRLLFHDDLRIRLNDLLDFESWEWFSAGGGSFSSVLLPPGLLTCCIYAVEGGSKGPAACNARPRLQPVTGVLERARDVLLHAATAQPTGFHAGWAKKE